MHISAKQCQLAPLPNLRFRTVDSGARPAPPFETVPALPDVTIYVEALEPRIGGKRLISVDLRSPFWLRSAEPPLASVLDERVTGLRHLGKWIALGLENDHWLVLHLMTVGRLRWCTHGKIRMTRRTIACFEFESGKLALTEAGTKKRASLYVVQGEAGLAPHTPLGIELPDTDLRAFSERLKCENQTLKRALTDQRLVAGIGNAYSDEILQRARLSPLALSQRLSDAEIERLYSGQPGCAG